MKNEVRINVYVWADFSVSTSRVDVRGRGSRAAGGEGRATGGRSPPHPGSTRRNAIDRLHSTATLHIDRGTNTRAAIHRQLLTNAT